jgi:hypothetical protein
MQGALTPFCRLSPDATFYVSNVIYLLILAVRIEVVKRYKKNDNGLEAYVVYVQPNEWRISGEGICTGYCGRYIYDNFGGVEVEVEVTLLIASWK